jgi:hypothetical protein
MNSAASFNVQFSIAEPTPYRLRANGGNKTRYWGHDISSAWVRFYRGSTLLMASEATRPTSDIDTAQALATSFDASGVLSPGTYTIDASLLATGHAEFSASAMHTGFDQFSVNLELPTPSTLMVPIAGLFACVGRRRR